ncbi:MAG: phosphoglycerate dehydrogenase, partial [Bacteroidia bacterium]|nr:phosphoglycerate dehydrogenase [Bacteroidia bacterium]
MKTSYPKDKINILLLEGVHPSVKKIFKQKGYTNLTYLKSSLPEDELIKQIKNVHLVGIRSKTQITNTVIEKANKLLAVGAFCIGTNQIDLAAAGKKGIAVFNSPFSNTRSVAELVIAEIVFLMRRIPERSSAALKGEWLKDASSSFEIRGKKLGIIGYGHIGSQVSVLAESLGMQIYYYDIESKLPHGNAVTCSSLDDLLKISDVVSLHVPSTPQTKWMIKEKQLKQMKKGAVILNLSRGNVV